MALSVVTDSVAIDSPATIPCGLSGTASPPLGSETSEMTAVLLAKCVKRTDASKRDEPLLFVFRQADPLERLAKLLEPRIGGY